MRLIDADELKKSLPSNWDLFMQVIGVIHLINEAKVVKPDSFVKQGKWIETHHENIWGDSTSVFECSACGKYTVGNKGITTKSKYCPNCGALMQEDNMDEWEKVLKRMKKNEKYLEGELFNLDDTLTAFILPRLKGFRDATIGYPPYLGSLENWQSELDKMIKAFQILYDCERLNTLSDSDEEAIEIGLKSFAEYYNHLWY